MSTMEDNIEPTKADQLAAAVELVLIAQEAPVPPPFHPHAYNLLKVALAEYYEEHQRSNCQ
jgi:hypothetical protein